MDNILNTTSTEEENTHTILEYLTYYGNSCPCV